MLGHNQDYALLDKVCRQIFHRYEEFYKLCRKREITEARRRRAHLSRSQRVGTRLACTRHNSPYSICHEEGYQNMFHNNDNPKSQRSSKRVARPPKHDDPIMMELIELIGLKRLSDIAAGFDFVEYLHLTRAYLSIKFVLKEYVAVVNVVEQLGDRGVSLSKSAEAELELIWNISWYHLAPIRNKNPEKLSSVDRYRVRQKHPFPLSHGDKKLYNIRVKAKQLMAGYFAMYPKPDRIMKEQIVTETGLSMEQVVNYFKNSRQKVKKETERMQKFNESLPVQEEPRTLMDRTNIEPFSDQGTQPTMYLQPLLISEQDEDFTFYHEMMMPSYPDDNFNYFVSMTGYY